MRVGGVLRRRLAAGLCLMAVLTAARAATAPVRVQRTRVVTPTRLVTLVHGLEYDLVDALRNADSAGVDRLLAEEFEQRLGSAPHQPVPRAEWLQAPPQKSTGGLRISEMAVHDRGELAIASFRLETDAPASRQFVVDIWRRKAESYELLTRYASELPSAAPVAPRPDGKR
jgi:hypothetical protein